MPAKAGKLVRRNRILTYIFYDNGQRRGATQIPATPRKGAVCVNRRIFNRIRRNTLFWVWDKPKHSSITGVNIKNSHEGRGGGRAMGGL